MRALRIYLEDIGGDWFAWIENCPGAYARAGTAEEAVLKAPPAVGQYVAWLTSHKHPIDVALAEMTQATLYIEMVERHNAERAPDGREVNAFFKFHQAPLTDGDIDNYIRLLSYARADLMDALREIPPDQFHCAPFGGRSITAVLAHVVDAERGALARVGLSVAADHRDAILALGMVRRDTERLARSVGARARDAETVDEDGERWNLRKALERILWHDRYHAAEIAQRTNPGAFLRSIVAHQEREVERTLAGVW